MKKINLILSFTLTALIYSCGTNTPSKEESPDPVKTECIYSYNEQSTNVHWIAYKHTAKAEVHGNFDSILVSGVQTGNNPLDVLKNAEITIYTSRVNTNDPERDGKIIKFFFGMMDGLGTITGKIKTIDQDGKATISITMNGVEKDVTLDYALNGMELKLNGSLSVNDWNGQNALQSINKVCEAKHTGTDGVNKIWDEIAISIKTVLVEECK